MHGEPELLVDPSGQLSRLTGGVCLTRLVEEVHDVIGEFIPTASFNSLPNVLVRKSAVTARSWLTSGTLRWS